MKPNKLFPLILLLALLAGCAAPTTPLPPISTPVPPTETLVPTQTPIPTATFTPTATPYPQLSSDGPYFAYMKRDGKQEFVVLLDADGKGRKDVLLPIDGHYFSYDLSHLSPDGKWLAYYKGSPNDFQYSVEYPHQSPYDLSLYLFNLETKESKLITPLLSDDFPNNFQKQADIFYTSSIPTDLSSPNDDIPLELYRSFINGIRSAAWSPDGRYLAFASQVNGLSSDLYVYDMESQSIRQLSSDSEEIQQISWSPDGQSVLYGSAYEVGEGMICSNYISSVDGISFRTLWNSSICGNPEVWMNDFVYLEYDAANVRGRFDLTSVDTRTGNIAVYWGGSFHSYSFDSQKQLILVSDSLDPYRPNDVTEGLYLINIATGQQTRIADGQWLIEFFGVGDRRFVASNWENRDYVPTYFVNSDGSLTKIEGNVKTVTASPDKQYWLMIDNKISVFAADNTLVREVNLPAQSKKNSGVNPIWSPDSRSLFFEYYNFPLTQDGYYSLYYLNLPSNDLNLIERDWKYWFYSAPPFQWVFPNQ